jgi:hypothetical protein
MNLQLYLTYSNKNQIPKKNIDDSNLIKEQFYNINTVKINLNNLQAKNERINVYMSYDHNKLAQKNNSDHVQAMKTNKLSRSHHKIK